LVFSRNVKSCNVFYFFYVLLYFCIINENKIFFLETWSYVIQNINIFLLKESFFFIVVVFVFFFKTKTSLFNTGKHLTNKFTSPNITYERVKRCKKSKINCKIVS
jgi:hypothetical protein